MARRVNTGDFRGMYGGDEHGLYTSRLRRNEMIYGKPPRRWPKIVLVVAIAVILICFIWQFACGGLPFLRADEQASQNPTEIENAEQDQQAQSEQAQSEQTAADTGQGTYQEGLNTQITITAVGDCTLGTDADFDTSTNFTAVYEDANDAYFFKNVVSFTENDDLTLANLEGPLTDSTDIQEKTFNFKGPAAYANILKEGNVEAVNLANNHSFDYGEEGYEDTKETLAEYDIVNFGYDRVATTEVNGITVGLFGINQLSNDKAQSTMEADIAELEEAGCALIIGMFHWGVEGEHDPTEKQVDLAHAAIDAGCDLVIGGHPHVLQGVELYKDRYICYSMGNFVFGGNSNPSDKNTMMYRQTFTFENGQLVVDDATLANAGIVPCSLSSSSSRNNYQPKALSGEDGSELVEKVNGYSADLSGDGVAFAESLNDDGIAMVEAS